MKTMTMTLVSLLSVSVGAAGCVPDSSDDTEAAAEAAIAPGQLLYTPVDVTDGPANLDGWGAFGVTDKGDVLGQGFDCDDEFIVCTLTLLARSPSGTFTTIATDFAVNDVDAAGDAGGCTVDPVTFNGQAAVVRADGHLEVFPRLPGEVSSCIIQVGGARVAVVASWDGAANSFYVFDRGRTVPFTLAASIEDVNDKGQVTGVIATPGANRAYRFDASTATTTVLAPLAGDPHSWGQAINHQGEVLGYSFVFDGVERIGAWSRKDAFEIAFVEGTPDVPPVSNRLIWNEQGLIVISATTDRNTYLVPQPGLRLNLADLVGGATAPGALTAFSINKRGDFLAFSSDNFRTYLLARK